MDKLTTGQRIARERKKQDLSQMGLAARLDVSRQAISKWESDAAIPEIDKLIALSRLFGVSVGWLLGVEEQPAAAESTISESQFQKIEELVKKYQTPPKPHLTVFHYLFAIGAFLLIFLLLYGTTTRLEKQILMYDANIAALNRRLEALEVSAQTATPAPVTPRQLLAGYSFDLYPLTKTKTTHRVKIAFSAVPNLWNKEDTGYLCVSGGDEGAKPFRIKCSWNGGQLAAEAVLDVADGYQICFAAEHANGSQEQQILEDPRIQKLAQECSIPIKVKRGSFSYQNGALTLTDFSVNFNLPPIYENQTTSEPSLIYCEYRLYRRPRNDSLPELTRADVLEHLEPSAVMDYRFQVSGAPVRFENVVLENTDYFHLWFYVKFDSGVEKEIPITTLIPDGKGGLTE